MSATVENLSACRAASIYYITGGKEICGRTGINLTQNFTGTASVADNVTNLGSSNNVSFPYDGTAPI